MAFECRKCEYFNENYIFNKETGDKIPLFFCEKSHNNELDSDCKCQYFKKYHDRKYVEKLDEVAFDYTNADEIWNRRIAGVPYEEIAMSVERENLQKIIDVAEKNGIDITEDVLNMCKELGIEV